MFCNYSVYEYENVSKPKLLILFNLIFVRLFNSALMCSTIILQILRERVYITLALILCDEIEVHVKKTGLSLFAQFIRLKTHTHKKNQTISMYSRKYHQLISNIIETM